MATLSDKPNNEQFDEIRRVRNRIKTLVTTVRNESASRDIERHLIGDLLDDLTHAINVFSAPKLTGFVDYVRSQYSAVTYDIDAHCTAMANAASTLRQTIYDAFPTGTNGDWLLGYRTLEGVWINDTFSIAAMSQFRTAADTFLSELESPVG